MNFPKTMKRYVLSHRNDLSGITFEQDAPLPQIKKSTEVSATIRYWVRILDLTWTKDFGKYQSVVFERP